ncbi:CAP domain-containing protein [Embleya sp. NBC_00888]|uniref:CAP domain-containing protein n=1 Tax=Embleya sp. NBC_00888 TaxID=2975960 RepID=UPI00386F4D26|nr:CAP domain-containing protein [Embleya sp. NBC_00888]
MQYRQYRHHRVMCTTLAAALAALVVTGCGSSAERHDGATRATTTTTDTASAPATTTAPTTAAPPASAGTTSPSTGTAPVTRKPTPSTSASRAGGTDGKAQPGKSARPTGPATPDGPPGADPTVRGNRPASQSIADAEAMSLELLNAERAKVGLRPLRASTDLSDFARKWAEHMRRTGFAHSGAEADALVTGARTGVAENIVWWGDPAMTARQAAEKFQDMWRHSPGHYRNQTDPGHTEAGIGIYRDESGWWGVHEFANG